MPFAYDWSGLFRSEWHFCATVMQRFALALKSAHVGSKVSRCKIDKKAKLPISPSKETLDICCSPGTWMSLAHSPANSC